jgi:D-sedoheptulose 7-phosphate isomerase
VGRYAKTRRSLPAIALSSDGSLLSCIGNDFGYEQVFARQVSGLAQRATCSSFSRPAETRQHHRRAERGKKIGVESISFLAAAAAKRKDSPHAI